MSYEFYADATQKSKRRDRRWYQENLLKVLEAAKEKRVREIDTSIALAHELITVKHKLLQIIIVDSRIIGEEG